MTKSAHTHPQAPHILIVGGGFAGLSMALALQQHELSFDIIEQHPHWPTQGTGVYLTGNAVRSLEALGIPPHTLTTQGARINQQCLLDHHGHPLAHIDTHHIWQHCGPCIGIQRQHLLALLVEHCQPLNVQFNTTVTSLQTHHNGVDVQFSDGQQQRYDLVIGADGIRSSIRNNAFGDQPATFLGQVGWRFITPCPNSIQNWTVFLKRGQAFLILPIGNNLAYCYADCTSTTRKRADERPHPQQLAELFHDFAPQVADIITRLADTHDPAIHFAPIEDVLYLPQQGRIALIGDAAHASSPNMASGAAMAFEDARVLAALLANTTALDDLVPHFYQQRMPRLQWLKKQTQLRDRMRALPAFLRNASLRYFGTRLYKKNYRPFFQDIFDPSPFLDD